MELSHEQQVALEHGEAVPVIIGHTPCIVVRQDIFEQSRDSSPADWYAAIEQVLDQGEDPGLESYQHYKQ